MTVHLFYGVDDHCCVSVFPMQAVRCEISPQYFAFRWISLLLTQEFELHRIYRLWDAILADDLRPNFVLFICVAMLMYVAEKKKNSI
jgi:hypothetical protein